MKIGLVLSGGGVLGVAHLGALRQLEENNIPIHSIAGTSAGAIIGSLFAAGGTKLIEEFISLLEQQNLFKSNTMIPLPDQIFTTVRKNLSSLLPDNFFDLRVKFYCTVTRYSDGECLVLEKGNLVDSIMASSAYPGVFAVQEIDGVSVIDGGISKNLPASILKDKKMDFIIGSSLYCIDSKEKYNAAEVNPNRFQAAKRAIDIMQKQLAEYEVQSCDFAFQPPLHTFSWYDFAKMKEIKKIGEDYAREKTPSMLQTLKGKSHPSFWQRIFSDNK